MKLCHGMCKLLSSHASIPKQVLPIIVLVMMLLPNFNFRKEHLDIISLRQWQQLTQFISLYNKSLRDKYISFPSKELKLIPLEKIVDFDCEKQSFDHTWLLSVIDKVDPGAMKEGIDLLFAKMAKFVSSGCKLKGALLEKSKQKIEESKQIEENSQKIEESNQPITEKPKE
ncbi:hypothetical protein RFI_03896 [Reticulomyxa filosa]|uniref:Uncharacterized protein n=1 Tax=Reticulomyxa filosa TaxID=46433 RepID=X6P516_RETFI|nr:hypothetical protein RFI_03896 [Reticulomyxa filosa]|eukprot:ETO33213.1 hypothetical protein RFI_03896 [Reticulomyxa filosa]